MCQALPSFYSDYSKKSLFISVSNESYEKYIVTQDYCMSTHNSSCSSENCKFHFILMGTYFYQIFHRLDKYIYVYQEIDCLYTTLNTDFIHVLLHQAEKYSMSLIEQFKITMERSRKDATIAKKRLIRKKYKRHYLSFNEKLASTQTHGSAFLDRIRKVQNSKYESDLLKSFDCFIDCHGSVNSDFVRFVMNL